MLNFQAYFLEPVVEDPNENYRVRNVTIYYYLDDDTIHIVEPKKENSGIPQGVFLKRHQLPKHEGEGLVQWEDLSVGSNLNVYGRVFRITDCDSFTRSFYANNGKDCGTAEPMPEDPFTTTRALANMKTNPPDLAEHKNYIEVQLKGGRPNKALKSFLDNDRNVLSF